MRYAILIIECNECGYSIEIPLNYVRGIGYQEPQELESQLEHKGWVYDCEAGSFCSPACQKKATKGRKPVEEIERL